MTGTHNAGLGLQGAARKHHPGPGKSLGEAWPHPLQWAVPAQGQRDGMAHLPEVLPMLRYPFLRSGTWSRRCAWAQGGWEAELVQSSPSKPAAQSFPLPSDHSLSLNIRRPWSPEPGWHRIPSALCPLSPQTWANKTGSSPPETLE